ncbi:MULTISPECIES: hypothetical protein [Bacillus subtilis group]|uniref:hypothetical protein n=1 Tax=Bacillus subtilis group TaxID=653685 RepID=UPI00084B9E2D|nr:MULTISPECIES: hypothetical protein [Bacillus subtilis group]MCY8796285.1 hypothetical protein [Bacillus inaquosorum]MEC0772007.1 hypothetical protein [Bacillus inaquosorum]MEC0797376.1 hypothetical protein [Bacillus inaquosorum]OEC78260.1 hypothetical protein BCV60_03935 [Bacillus halotolerans]
MSKVIAQSQKHVSKAVGVFSQAVNEVEKAQTVLQEGIKADSAKVLSIKSQISKLEQDIEKTEKSKEAKGAEFKKNQDLLANLKQFTEGK